MARVDISTATEMDLPRSNRIVVESLKACIRQGHQIFDDIPAYFTIDAGTSMEAFCYRLNTLWKLCMMVGAGLCEPHNFFPEEADAASRSRTVQYVCEFLSGIESNIERSLHKPAPGDPITSRGDLAGIMGGQLETYEYTQNLDKLVDKMTGWNFTLNAKPLGGEGGLIGL